jgi:hypothetical protein
MKTLFNRNVIFIIYLLITLSISVFFVSGGDGDFFPLLLFFSWGITLTRIFPEDLSFCALILYQVAYFILTEVIILIKFSQIYFLLLGFHLLGIILFIIFRGISLFKLNELSGIILNLISLLIFILYYYNDYKLFNKSFNKDRV